MNDDGPAVRTAARRSVALLAELCLHAAVTAESRPAAKRRADALTVSRARRYVGRPSVALLEAVSHAIATIRRERAIGPAGAVASVIDAVVAILARLAGSVSAFEAAANVASALRATVLRSTIVALLGRLHPTVTARRQSHGMLAVGGAGSGLAVVDAVIADFAEGAVDGPVTALGSGQAGDVTEIPAVRSGAVLRSEIAELGRVRDLAVAAIIGKYAPRLAGTVGPVVLAVVALLCAVDEPVAAARPERAGG